MKRNSTSPWPTTGYSPLTGIKLVVATIVVAFVTFISALDVPIANVAIPTISGNVGSSVDEGTWVITISATVDAASIPLTAWFGQRFEEVRLFVGPFLNLVVVSWLAGIALSLPLLFAARVLKGVLAGPLILLSQSALPSSYPTDKASLALALRATTATVRETAS